MTNTNGRGGARPGAGRKPKLLGHVDDAQVRAEMAADVAPKLLARLTDRAAELDLAAIRALSRLRYRAEQKILASRGAASAPEPAAGDLFGGLEPMER